MIDKRITKPDILSDKNGNESAWRFATRIVTSNKEVNVINKSQVLRFAKDKGKPVYFWHCQPTGAELTADLENRLSNLAEDVPQMIQYFVEGAPCMITKNTYMKHGVANGTSGTMHSLTWKDDTYSPKVPRNCFPGQLVQVLQPYSFNVNVPIEICANKDDILQFATENIQPVFYWYNSAGTIQYFSRGAPCNLSGKRYSQQMVPKGTISSMISLSWDDKRYKFPLLPHGFVPGQLIKIRQPSKINVRLRDVPLKDNRTKSRVKRSNIITINLNMIVPIIKVAHNFAITKYNYKTKKRGLALKCFSHHVKLTFAITFHKAQGQTLTHVVLHLHKRPGRCLKNLCFQGLYVALSRVRRGCCIRVSFDTKTGLKHLMNLKRPPKFDLWIKNYCEKTGLWISEGMDTLRKNKIKSALSTLKRTKSLDMLNKVTLSNLCRVLDITVQKSNQGALNKMQYNNALYDKWCKVRGLSTEPSQQDTCTHSRPKRKITLCSNSKHTEPAACNDISFKQVKTANENKSKHNSNNNEDRVKSLVKFKHQKKTSTKEIETMYECQEEYIPHSPITRKRSRGNDVNTPTKSGHGTKRIQKRTTRSHRKLVFGSKKEQFCVSSISDCVIATRTKNVLGTKRAQPPNTRFDRKFELAQTKLCLPSVSHAVTDITSSCITSSEQRSSSSTDQQRYWIKVHGDGFCWLYSFLVAIGELNTNDFPHGDNVSWRPSANAIRISRLLAPYAFQYRQQCCLPRYYRNGRLIHAGTYGGHRNFAWLLARMRPSFRFFVLEPNRSVIRFAAITDSDLLLHADSGFGINWDQFFVRFQHELHPCENVLSYEYNGLPDEDTFKLVFSVTEMKDKNNILCHRNDVVICWASRNHFNALSAGCHRNNFILSRFLEKIRNGSERIRPYLPLSLPRVANGNNSDNETVEFRDNVGYLVCKRKR